MTDQLDARIRALVLEVVDSGPVPPPFEDIASGLERDPAVGDGHGRRRRVAVTVALAAGLTLAGAVALVADSRDTALPRVSTPGATTTKPAKAKDACNLVTTTEQLAAAHGRTTPAFGIKDLGNQKSYCEFGPFEATGADGGAVDYWVSIDETVGPRAAATYQNARRQLTGTTRTRLSGLPKGFVGVTGSPKAGSDALTPVAYVAYSKTSEKLLIVGAFPTSSTALDRQVAADPVLPAEERNRELLRFFRASAEADSTCKGFLVLALGRL
jgi:hypothetical protein